jgi:hypothetical protein
LEKDSKRKEAFEGELEGIQSNLMILRQHVNVPKRFENVKEDVQIQGLGVLSAMLDLIGRQLVYVNISGGKIGTKLSQQCSNLKCVQYRRFSPALRNGMTMRVSK